MNWNKQYKHQAWQKFKQRSYAEGARLVLSIASYLRGLLGDKEKPHHALHCKRLISDELGMLFRDQFNFVLKKDRYHKNVWFRHEGHWNDQGRLWAAEAALQYLEKNTSVHKTP